jgi:2-keto-4-pentenoate hydratase/2-oxohepta-3-ene-1,7-dioic acid hydratase in catechol pathway
MADRISAGRGPAEGPCENIRRRMKIATFTTDSRPPMLGVVLEGESVVSAQAAHELLHGGPSAALAGALALIEAGPEALALAGELAREAPAECRHRLADVRLAAPLPEPPQIRDFLCFEEHLKNSFAQGAKLTGQERAIPAVWYQQPIYYKANRFSVNGPEADVRWPSYSQVMDYELELACVIGAGGRDIAAERAEGHIFGYTIFNDASARDAQMVEMAGQLGPAKGKDFDTGNVFGPWIVTADELGDPYSLEMLARVNGEEWSRGSSASMHHRFEDLIAFVSRSETLHPGEILGSGTVGGGCGLEQGRFLSDGDVVELEIQGIGVLRNRFVR